MTEEEKQRFFEKFDKFIEESRKNFGHLFDDIETDARKLDEVYVLLGKVLSEMHVLTGNVATQTKTVKKEAEHLVEHIEGNTKVIIKEVDKTKKRWYQFWKGGKNGSK